jgi:general secretion pathway protein G
VLLAAVVGPRVIQHFGKAKHDTARIQLNNITTALELYYMDLGKYPPMEPGLLALVTKPSSETRWNGPYLQKADGLTDPWQNAYRYAIPGQHAAYDLYSLGGDNAEGGDGEGADIRNW